MRRLTFASLFAALLVMTLGLASVGAAPANNPHAEMFTLECSNGEAYDVVVGSGNPAHIIGTTQRLIPHHFTFALVAVDEDGVETVLFEESGGIGEGQKRGLQDGLVTCTADDALTAEEIEDIEQELGLDLTGMDVFFQITVQVMITPAGPQS